MIATHQKSASGMAPLGTVAHVQPGYVTRTKFRASPDGTHYLLQNRDLTESGVVQPDDSSRFYPKRRPELYEVATGDILLVARGQDHRAYLIESPLEETLASATFYIIRSDHARVLPGYLNWWLNQPSVQADIQSAARGTGISYLRRQALERLTIPLPPLEVQRRIEKVMRLWRATQELDRAITEKRQQHIDGLCRQAVARATQTQ